MHLTIKERVELVLMSGADGATNRSVAKKFNRIYTRIADVDHLRQQIIRGCNLINGNSDLLDKVYGNFEHRLELCINANGEHFEHL